jgi:hypothetical protein
LSTSVNKRIIFAVSTGWGSKAVSILVNLVQIPLLFRYLDDELLGVFDFGLGQTLQRRIAFTKGVFYSFPSWRFGRGIFLIDMVFIIVLVYSWRLLFQSVFVSVRRLEKIIIIGAGESGKTIYDILKMSNGFEIKGFLDDDYRKRAMKIDGYPVIGHSDLITEMSDKNEIDSAVIAVTYKRSSELMRHALDAKMKGVEIYDMASLYEELTGKLPVNHLEDNWLVSASFLGTRKSIYTTRIKRLLDLGFSVIALILATPLLIVVSIAIKLDSKGPILFKQKRVGYDEKVYDLL